MQKYFVLDTNVLLTDPHAILKFEDNHVVLPITVIEELDKFKRDLNDLGRNAREATRLIDRYRSQGSLAKGVPLESGGTLRVMTFLGKEPPAPFPSLGKSADGLILAAALLLKKQEDAPVVMVTRDVNLRLRADAVELRTEDYEVDYAVPIEELYSGQMVFETDGDSVSSLHKGSTKPPEGLTLEANQFVTLVDKADPEQQAEGRWDPQRGEIVPLRAGLRETWGIRPRNAEQCFAFELLLDDRVEMVTLAGKAGTGKTLLALAAGMRKVVSEKVYSKLVVARPIMPLGKELGFLPGEMGEKLRPWMEPIFDNLELITRARGEKGDGEPSRRSARKGKGSSRQDAPAGAINEFLGAGILEVQPLTYIRGRSLPGQYLIIDEAQNLTLHEVKTVITRAGEGTKVVLTGDPYQIDNPFLDATNNGLTTVVQRFKGQETTGHVTLTQGERSGLAELASDLL